MKIIELLDRRSILLNGAPASKKDALDQMIALMVKSGKIRDEEAYRQEVYRREEEGTTGIGEGIAIPHGKCDAVIKPGLAAMVIPNGVDFDSLDGQPVHLIFLIAAPNTKDNIHLDVLSKLSMLLMDEKFAENLKNAKTVDEFLEIVDHADQEKPDVDDQLAAQTENEPAQYKCRILAVTSCPTGIAHTYMAAEALEKKAREMGYSLKAETNGSGGAKNVLTPEEIEAADGIIIAADKNVEMVRFDGKRVYKTNVSAGINKPEELIKKIIDKEAPVFHYEGAKTTNADSVGKEGIGHQIYKHLMNGVSYMLPFVIGGGIMIALAFLIDTIAGAPRNSDFGTYTAAAAFFKSIGNVAFNFMMPVLAGYIARSIADRPGLAVGFVGGSIATLGCTFANVTGDASAVSGFLGALIAGFVGGFIVLLLKKVFSFLPDSLESMLPVLILPLLGITLMGAFMCFINPAVGAINTAITNGLNSMGSASQILLGCLLGGMMAIDMGGPFNKAAYVFGTAAIASGGFNIMASVMIGGMVPPIAIALATTFFKNKFTAEERKAGVVNYIMGLCFITEGAIPFAASDPLRVIPSCVVGSAVAGGISMAMGCGLRAPHGGIFVFPVVENVGGYLLALVVGAVVGMVLLAILKKNKT